MQVCPRAGESAVLGTLVPSGTSSGSAPALTTSSGEDCLKYRQVETGCVSDGHPVTGPLVVPDLLSSPLDNAQRYLETSGEKPWVLAPDYYGSVDNHDGFSPSLAREAQFRHSSWAAPRRRIYQAMLRLGLSCRRSQHFAECGSALWLLKDGTELALACNHCHDRLCLPCQKQRQAALVEGIILRMLDSSMECRFLTLTLKHSDSPLAVQLERLISSFKALRKHPEISDNLAGGAWFIEVKLSKDKSRWHPHLHVIAAGHFIDARSLSRCWLQVTGDSYITDIRAIGSIRERAAYVAKYATKPLHNEVTLQPAKLDEFITAIKGKRLYQCFGSWSKAVNRDKGGKHDLARVGRLSSVWEDACAGDIQALVYMHQAHARWPKLRKAFPLPSQYGGHVQHPTPESFDPAPP
jgi:Replication protein